MRQNANESRSTLKKLTEKLIKLEDNQKEKKKLENLKKQIEETMK